MRKAIGPGPRPGPGIAKAGPARDNRMTLSAYYALCIADSTRQPLKRTATGVQIPATLTPISQRLKMKVNYIKESVAAFCCSIKLEKEGGERLCMWCRGQE